MLKWTVIAMLVAHIAEELTDARVRGRPYWWWVGYSLLALAWLIALILYG